MMLRKAADQTRRYGEVPSVCAVCGPSVHLLALSSHGCGLRRSPFTGMSLQISICDRLVREDLVARREVPFKSAEPSARYFLATARCAYTAFAMLQDFLVEAPDIDDGDADTSDDESDGPFVRDTDRRQAARLAQVGRFHAFWSSFDVRPSVGAHDIPSTRSWSQHHSLGHPFLCGNTLCAGLFSHDAEACRRA